MSTSSRYLETLITTSYKNIDDNSREFDSPPTLSMKVVDRPLHKLLRVHGDIGLDKSNDGSLRFYVSYTRQLLLVVSIQGPSGRSSTTLPCRQTTMVLIKSTLADDAVMLSSLLSFSYRCYVLGRSVTRI